MLIGVVGKTNTGKSTFFKALTLAEVEISNRPFVTIKPNRGYGYVKVKCPEREFNVKCNPREGYCIDGNRFVPVELLDVAGLIPGAHKGAGLGNQFLDDLRQADCLIHVVDVSGGTNENGEMVDPLSYYPGNDIKFLEHELDMWYLGILKKGWEKFVRQVQQENLDIKKALAKQLSGLKVTEEIVQNSIKKLDLVHDPIKWDGEDLFNLARELRRITKPMIIAANKIDVKGSKVYLNKIKDEFKDYLIMPCSSESELALKEAAKNNLISYIPGEDKFKIIEKDKLSNRQLNALEFIKDNVLKEYKSTGVQDVLNKAVFELLKYIAIFPVATNKLADKDGNILPDCHLVPNNLTAEEFAFKVHTDIGENFIKAIDVKTKRVIGKDYVLKDGDVIEIVVKK